MTLDPTSNHFCSLNKLLPLKVCIYPVIYPISGFIVTEIKQVKLRFALGKVVALPMYIGAELPTVKEVLSPLASIVAPVA